MRAPDGVAVDEPAPEREAERVGQVREEGEVPQRVDFFARAKMSGTCVVHKDFLLLMHCPPQLTMKTKRLL